jgi:hypothetical protein
MIAKRFGTHQALPGLAPLVLLLWVGCAPEQKYVSGWEGWEPPVCQGGASCCTQDELICKGDPDDGLVCTCHRSWSCDDPNAPTACSQQHDTPDGGTGWTCEFDVEFETCERSGTSAPEGKNGWSCKIKDGKVVCRRPSNTPDGSTDWDCTYEKGGIKKCKYVAPSTNLPGNSGVIPGGTTTKGSCKPDTPDVMIVLDKSGSMASGIGSATKWSHAVTAVNSLLATYNGTIRFGLLLFPLQSASDACTAGEVDVKVGINTYSSITSTLAKVSPYGGTPMGASLLKALTAQSAGDPSTDKYVLLVTDGGETCGGDPLGAVGKLASAKIKTYVVGFGSGVNPVLLDAMAKAGGTALTGATAYYRADDTTELSTALKSIASDMCK